MELTDNIPAASTLSLKGYPFCNRLYIRELNRIPSRENASLWLTVYLLGICLTSAACLYAETALTLRRQLAAGLVVPSFRDDTSIQRNRWFVTQTAEVFAQCANSTYILYYIIIKYFMISRRTLYHIAQLYRSLPSSFSRKHALKQIAPRQYLRPRTLDKYISILRNGYLRRERGVHIKQGTTLR
jgi:hypothetical protein